MVNETMIFQAIMQFAQHGIYNKSQSPQEALAEAKLLVDQMITESKELASKHNEEVI